jgi:ribosome biogenesis GTPase A
MTYMQVEKWFEERFHGRKQGIKNGINVLKKLDLIEERQDEPWKKYDLTKNGREYLSSEDRNDFLFKIVNRTYGGLSEIVDILKKNGALSRDDIQGQLSKISDKNLKNNHPFIRRLQMLVGLNTIRHHDKKYDLYTPKNLANSYTY